MVNIKKKKRRRRKGIDEILKGGKGGIFLLNTKWNFRVKKISEIVTFWKMFNNGML